MNSWDDFIWLFTHPIFLALLAFSIALEPFLKYLRRYYPKRLRQVIIENEILEKELEKSVDDRNLQKKARSIEGIIVFLPALISYLIYLIYSYFTGSVLTPKYVIHSFGFIAASIMMISTGIYIIKHNDFMKYILKSDYQRYSEIYRNKVDIDPYLKVVEKYSKSLSYVLIAFGLFCLIAFIFDCGCLK